MKVAIYYPWVYLFGGPERTLSEILARSRHTWTVYTNRYEPESTFPALKTAGIVQFATVPTKRSFFRVAQAAGRIAIQKLPLEQHDAYLIFCEGLGDLTLFRNHSVPVACLCFTPLRAAFDPYYQQHYLSISSHRFLREPILRAGAAAFRVLDRYLWKRYRRVFAISKEVEQRIVRGRLFSPEKIDVIYPGVDVTRLVPSEVYDKNFLIPGRIMWTKNLELAIDAFLLLRNRRKDLGDFTLTIAGFVDAKSKPYLAKLRERTAGCERIRFIVAPSDEELFALCSRAYTVLYPPLNEDWGLAPIEAMALAKPVISVNRGGPKETVIHGETGFLVEPQPAAFADSMELLADQPNLVREMGKRARRRALEFDWSIFIEKLDDYVAQLASPVRDADREQCLGGSA